MKAITATLGAIGTICLLSAAGNDDYYSAAGTSYPMVNILGWILGGVFCIGAAWMIERRRQRTNRGGVKCTSTIRH